MTRQVVNRTNERRELEMTNALLPSSKRRSGATILAQWKRPQQPLPQSSATPRDVRHRMDS
jgi:hypothetical protein